MAGFTIGKQGTFLETVNFDNNLEISLVTRGDGVEIITQSIGEGKLFYVYPSENVDALEFYYILSGEVECELNNKKHILGPEDFFSAKGISDPIHFTALSKVTLLCVFTEQIFVHISKDISSLIEIKKQVEIKDRYTQKHSDRVANYSVKIAKKLKLDKERLVNLTTASVLHDIGKINVPIEILNKPGRLTDEEYEIIKKHPVDGAEMIKDSYYKELAPIIEQHHERLNGSGYPNGLSGEDIVLEARIIAVSDTFDAMTEDRAYRKAFKEQIAIDELKRLAGSHYDEEVVMALEQILIEEGRIS
ncbi:HD-GYP domain-containing protein [Bacillus sp. JJ1562]|uniref:HD-GYP domain-containing protein n=1 Tax=Bacillus sp. JJ1562 TaxID=3122960 RepID=UPI003001DDF0